MHEHHSEMESTGVNRSPEGPQAPMAKLRHTVLSRVPGHSHPLGGEQTVQVTASGCLRARPLALRAPHLGDHEGAGIFLQETAVLLPRGNPSSLQASLAWRTPTSWLREPRVSGQAEGTARGSVLMPQALCWRPGSEPKMDYSRKFHEPD